MAGMPPHLTTGDNLLNPSAIWLIFCRRRFLKDQLQWSCLCGSRAVAAEFALSQPSGYYSLAVEGTLLNTKFALEARSRRRLEGDACDSHVPLFVGTFEHQNGASGDFTIRPQDNGELMTLGVYGTPHSIRVVKVRPDRTESPLEIHGIPDVDIRFERFGDTWHPPSVPKDEIPVKRGRGIGPGTYVGRCITTRGPAASDRVPPMVSVLATMTIAYDQLLLQHHMRGGD